MLISIDILIVHYFFFRMSAACQKKCVPPKYKEADLSKGESVCLDRCVAKYMDIHDRIGKKLTSITMSDQETAQKLQAAQLASKSTK
jgi:mitochondrial import inner membrane translocase subunit TIM10